MPKKSKMKRKESLDDKNKSKQSIVSSEIVLSRDFNYTSYDDYLLIETDKWIHNRIKKHSDTSILYDINNEIFSSFSKNNICLNNFNIHPNSILILGHGSYTSTTNAMESFL